MAASREHPFVRSSESACNARYVVLAMAGIYLSEGIVQVPRCVAASCYVPLKRLSAFAKFLVLIKWSASSS